MKDFSSLLFATVYSRPPQAVLFLGTDLGTSLGRHMTSKLTARKVKTAKPGKYSDGGNLYLIVSKTGARKWVLRFTWRGRAKEMGLGSAASVPLADAREKAASAPENCPRAQPVEERKRDSGITAEATRWTSAGSSWTHGPPIASPSALAMLFRCISGTRDESLASVRVYGSNWADRSLGIAPVRITLWTKS